MGLCKTHLAKWGYKKDGDVSCLCGEEQTIAHLSCPLLPTQCTNADLAVLMQDCAWNTGANTFKLEVTQKELR